MITRYITVRFPIDSEIAINDVNFYQLIPALLEENDDNFKMEDFEMNGEEPISVNTTDKHLILTYAFKVKDDIAQKFI